jgi:hypothetical protein
MHLALVESGACHLTTLDEDRPHLGSAGCHHAEVRLLDGQAHEISVLLVGHAGLDAQFVRRRVRTSIV